MSNLSGHNQITQQAIRELDRSCSSHPIGANLDAGAIPGSVVSRDLIDVVIVGHWSDFGQAHHFMRRFDGQSPFEAYKECVSWISSNALEAAQHLSKRMQRLLSQKQITASRPGAISQTCSLPAMSSNAAAMAQGRKVMGGDTRMATGGYQEKEPVSWQNLGYAIHALQDSFSEGHVVRTKSASLTHPGAIEYIKKYGGADKKDHEHFDELWFNARKANFSTTGRQAINATKDMILMVINTAQVTARGNSPSALRGWDAFKLQWLAASPKLSTQRDFAVDLIEKYHSGWHIGNYNMLSANMDEAGLAKAIYTQAGSDTNKIYKVFYRLDVHYNSDSDDVAVYYVDMVRKQGGAVEKAISADKKLINLLIKIMDEGYTADNEEKAIKYLKSL